MTTIQLELRSNYGSEAIYPACETARMLCELFNTKTFTTRHLAILQRLGYRFQVVDKAGQRLAKRFEAA